MNERMDAGEGEESKGNALIITLEGRGDRGAEEETRWREGKSESAEGGGSNGVFVLAGVTHKALAGAAQLSYRYQTQRVRRAENVHVCVCVLV